MSSEEILKNCISKMKKAFDIFSQDLSSLRTGRANVHMLDIVKVDVYGQSMSINQLANLSTPEGEVAAPKVCEPSEIPESLSTDVISASLGSGNSIGLPSIGIVPKFI